MALIENDPSFRYFKNILIGVLIFEFLLIHFNFLSETLAGAPGDILAFGVYFTFIIIIFAVLFFAILIEHLQILMATTCLLVLNTIFLIFIPISGVAAFVYFFLIATVAFFTYTLSRGGLAVMINSQA